MSPFRDAMCLVNSNPGKFSLLMHDSKGLPEGFTCTVLRGDIKEPCQWMSSGQVCQQTLPFSILCSSVYRPSCNVRRQKCIYLIGLGIILAIVWSLREHLTIKDRSGDITMVTRGIKLVEYSEWNVFRSPHSHGQ